MRWWWAAEDIGPQLDQLGERLTRLDERMARLERKLDKMPTREELDAAKADLKQAIADASNRVVATIDALKAQLANGAPVTAQDLDDLKSDVAALGQIDPLQTP